MPQLATTPPLTTLSEEEELFRDTVRDFAVRAVKPRVAAMERAAAIDLAVLTQGFEIGLMGIETPEDHGGAGREPPQTAAGAGGPPAVAAPRSHLPAAPNTPRVNLVAPAG